MNKICIIVFLCVFGITNGFPQLESFDQFFEKFGSGQFSKPTFNSPPSHPSQSASSPQLTSAPSSSFKQSGEAGKFFPTAVPYVHDPSGDGAAARRQQASNRREDPQPIPQQSAAKNEVVDPKSHEAALQRNALHRQQLAEVIEKHNQVPAEREQEIFRSSTEEIDEDDQILDTRRVKITSAPINRNKKTKVSKKLNLEAYLRTEPREAPSASGKEYLDDIKEDVIENLDLIGLLAEQIAELDIQAYQVFSKQKEGKRKKSSSFKKKPRRKENRRESYEEEE